MRIDSAMVRALKEDLPFYGYCPDRDLVFKVVDLSRNFFYLDDGSKLTPTKKIMTFEKFSEADLFRKKQIAKEIQLRFESVKKDFEFMLEFMEENPDLFI